MLIFVQTLKANLKTNKNALSLAKETKSKQGQRKQKPSFQEVFFKSKNKKPTFQKCSKYYWKLWDWKIGNKNTLQVINSKWVKTQQNRCFKVLLMTKKQQKELGDNDQKTKKDNFQNHQSTTFKKWEKQMATRCNFDTKQEDHKDKVCHKDWN